MAKIPYFKIMFLLCFLIWLVPKTEAAITPTYLYHNCTNTTTFTPNSTYHSNLNHLLSFLSSNATLEFYYATAGNDSSTSVHGLFLCRGDVNTTACRDCVRFATQDVLKRCPVEKEVIIWYDECQLRYSNRSFFGTVDELPRIFLYNTANITGPDRFRETLNVTIIEAASAAAGGEQKKFATNEANFSGFQSLYTLAQCTPDLSSFDCNRCLLDANERLYNRFSDSQGARILFPSCNFRFELYPFYNQAASQPSPVIPPPAAVTRPKGKSRVSSSTIFAIATSVSVVSLALLVAGYCIMRHTRATNKSKNISRENGENEITTVESLQFNMATIKTATNRFSEDNKIGEGGFGEVYKGTLPNGQEIAVKRLSKSSGQGGEEFKNEVVLVAKLQHRNLVRLLGFCLEGGEKLLVYEFVPNKSLDYLLFVPEKQGDLDWPKRHKIIGGIARGILYLHEDSRLKVIHRDLKTSNVLLDADMNPKVSDFGMARMFDTNQTEGNTARIVGTYGYMAPEYAMEGLYSIKSDVFSFGVLLLEILSGRKNSGFHLTELGSSLLIYAWNLWNEGKVMELMDPLLKQSCGANEFMRYVHIGLLCVQEDAYDRPTMSSVLLMLTTETISLSKPQRPAFSVGRNIPHHHHHQLQLGPECSSSDNGLTISTFVPR